MFISGHHGQVDLCHRHNTTILLSPHPSERYHDTTIPSSRQGIPTMPATPLSPHTIGQLMIMQYVFVETYHKVESSTTALTVPLSVKTTVSTYHLFSVISNQITGPTGFLGSLIGKFKFTYKKISRSHYLIQNH